MTVLMALILDCLGFSFLNYWKVYFVLISHKKSNLMHKSSHLHLGVFSLASWCPRNYFLSKSWWLPNKNIANFVLPSQMVIWIRSSTRMPLLILEICGNNKSGSDWHKKTPRPSRIHFYKEKKNIFRVKSRQIYALRKYMVIIMLIITRMAKKNGDLFSLASVTTLILVSYVQQRTITSLFLHFFLF